MSQPHLKKQKNKIKTKKTPHQIDINNTHSNEQSNTTLDDDQRNCQKRLG